MGYIDGKTDTDLLLEEGDDTEDRERIMILQVRTCCHGNAHVDWVGSTKKIVSIAPFQNREKDSNFWCNF